MNDFISREAAIAATCKMCRDTSEKYGEEWKCVDGGITCCAGINAIKNVPAADVRSVVRGKWTEIDASYWRWKHDGAHMVFRKKYKHIDCGEVCASKKPYCPNCGADMREVER